MSLNKLQNGFMSYLEHGGSVVILANKCAEIEVRPKVFRTIKYDDFQALRQTGKLVEAERSVWKLRKIKKK